MKGFTIDDVEGDGNCFYRAVEKQLELLNLPRMTHTELRQNLILYLENETKTRNYAPFVAQPIKHIHSDALLQDTEPRSDTDDYIDNIDNSTDQTEIRWIRYIDKISTGAWADHIAVQALADMLKLNINIISTLNPDTPVIQPELSQNNLVTINLGLIGQTHYVSLKKTENPISQHESSHIDEMDINEFESNCKLRGLPFNTCLQPGNQVISIAPGENKKPIHFLTDKYFEEMANPVKYPYGSGGFSDERKVRLTIRRYFNQRLLDVDGRFSKDVDYMLAAQFAVESKQLEDQTNIALRQTHGRQFKNKNVTAGDLKDPVKLNQFR